MNEIPEEMKKTLLSIVDKDLREISQKASEITLYSLMKKDSTFTMELFSQNVEEYLYLMITQDLTTSFYACIKNVLKEISEVLVQYQEGQVIDSPEPYDLKFKLKNGEEYWVDFQTSRTREENNNQILARKTKAEKAGKKYKLCSLDEPDPNDEEYKLNETCLWEQITGNKNTGQEVFKSINGSANALSLSRIIEKSHKRILREWRMQE